MVPNRRQLLLVAMAALLVASCGLGGPPAGDEQNGPPASPPPSGDLSPTAESLPSPSADCEAPAIQLTLGAQVTSEITGSDQPPGERIYYCVEVPDGTTSMTFELTGTTADLNLFVGYPDLATVQNGGVWFWSSMEPDTQAEVILVEPALTDYVNPGPYYAEVSAQDYRDSSPFTLVATVP